jgi:hypothetical protein
MTATVDTLKALHRKRRYWMKLQQKIDRALESYVRINFTAWSPDLDEKQRAAENKKALALLTAARKGEGDPELIRIVTRTELVREPIDLERTEMERQMTQAAAALPVYAYVESVHGAAALGLGTIIAETGDLANYANPGKVWSRLGFAPYDGLAGSSWKRETWRPRSLTKEEWIAHPFNASRYALMFQIGLWLVNAQVEGKEKSGTDYGRPKGPYGEAYVSRRKHTAVTHPDWTPMHARQDAVRYVMKRYLKHLWQAWRKLPISDEHEMPRKRRGRAGVVVIPAVGLPGHLST